MSKLKHPFLEGKLITVKFQKLIVNISTVEICMKPSNPLRPEIKIHHVPLSLLSNHKNSQNLQIHRNKKISKSQSNSGTSSKQPPNSDPTQKIVISHLLR